MFKKLVLLVIAALAWLGQGNAAQAQNLDMSNLVHMQLNFDRQFDVWARKGSLEAARSLRLNGQQNPFNAMTISAANQQAQEAFTGYVRQSQLNSQRTSQAVSNWTNGAVRGVRPYVDPNTGTRYNLPWTHNQYHLNPYGQAVPGYNPYRTNLNPYYGR